MKPAVAIRKSAEDFDGEATERASGDPTDLEPPDKRLSHHPAHASHGDRVEAALRDLRAAYQQSELILSIINLAEFDQMTLMPDGGSVHRAKQIAYLRGERHRCLTDPRMTDWLDIVGQSTRSSEPEIGATLRAIRAERDQLIRVPIALTEAIEGASSAAIQKWREAREARDFRAYEPSLDAVIALKQEEADVLRDGRADTVSRHDVFLGYLDPGITTQHYRDVVGTLRRELQPLIDGLDSSESPIAPCLIGRSFPARRIEALAARFTEYLGLDRTRTRFIAGLAPVSAAVGPADFRITTRCEENELLYALSLTAHEAGHAFYRRALDARPFGDPLNEPASVSIDEAHARLWEAIILKLPQFWGRAYPVVKRHFRRALRDVSGAEFLDAMRYAVRGGTRARTDDLSYCLLNDVQAEIEIALLDGCLRAEDVPGEFDRRIMAILGAKPDLLRAALSNIHWAANWFGRFPTYTIGSVFAGQLWTAMTRAIPGLLNQIARGDFDAIHAWLWQHVQRHGRLLLPSELMIRATGVALDPRPWVDLLRQQYAR